MSDESPQIAPSEPKVPDYASLARMVAREGKPFYSSALACGYSESVALRGPKAMAEDSKRFSEALKRESESMVTLDNLKPLAIQRLHDEIINPKSGLGMKAIEIAGRFKETDWFVRNAEVNIGVFAALGEQAPDATASAIDAYAEPEKSY